MSKAEEMFKALKDARVYTLAGHLMIVEELNKPEITTKAGLIYTPEKRLGQNASDIPTYVKVLQIGNGYEDEDTGRFVKPAFSPGQVLLVGGLSTVRWYSELFGVLPSVAGLRIGIMVAEEDCAYAVFEDEAAYMQAFDVAEKFK